MVWPGDPPVAVDTIEAATQAGTCTISHLHLGSHTGTHIDAPRHFLRGAPGVDSIDPDILIGRARLFHVPSAHHIDRELLRGLDLKGVVRLLLATRNSALLHQEKFQKDYAFVSEDAARYLVELGIKLLGIDYLSVEDYRNLACPTHLTLLQARVVIVEGLDLCAAPPGDYELICLPLKIKDGDGAPARAFLREI